ncbi:hypothetical protein CLAIMM_09523 isoform 2, partial [Cladophialophora immunda]
SVLMQRTSSGAKAVYKREGLTPSAVATVSLPLLQHRLGSGTDILATNVRLPLTVAVHAEHSLEIPANASADSASPPSFADQLKLGSNAVVEMNEESSRPPRKQNSSCDGCRSSRIRCDAAHRREAVVGGLLNGAL